MRHITSHLVKAFDIGANQNLFGGRMLEWLDEAGVIYTQQLCPGNFVTLKLGEVIFHHPVKEHTVIDFYVNDLNAGKSSVNFKVIVRCREVQVVSADMIFVHTDQLSQKQYFNLFDFALDGFREAIYHRVRPYYPPEVRKYHSVAHLDRMLEHLDRLQAENLFPSPLEYKELYLAVGYQYAGYTPGADDNENIAAGLLQRDFGHLADPGFRARLEHVAALIQSTRPDYPQEKRAAIRHADLLHDLDHMLFADYAQLEAGLKQIEYEFCGDSADPECRCRCHVRCRNFLQTLLDRPIFLTTRFAPLNVQAQVNPKNFIAAHP